MITLGLLGVFALGYFDEEVESSVPTNIDAKI